MHFNSRNLKYLRTPKMFHCTFKGLHLSFSLTSRIRMHCRNNSNIYSFYGNKAVFQQSEFYIDDAGDIIVKYR